MKLKGYENYCSKRLRIVGDYNVCYEGCACDNINGISYHMFRLVAFKDGKQKGENIVYFRSGVDYLFPTFEDEKTIKEYYVQSRFSKFAIKCKIVAEVNRL